MSMSPGATTEATMAYAAVVGIPMPRMSEMNMEKTRARSCPSMNVTPFAMPRSSEENRAPTPVSAMTPTMTPAQAHTATIWIDMMPAIDSAFATPSGPIRFADSQETTTAASVASVPARITE